MAPKTTTTGLLTTTFVKQHAKYFYQIQFYCDTDTGYSSDSQMFSFIRWSLSQEELLKLLARVSAVGKQIKLLVQETLQKKDAFDKEFWEKVFELLQIDYKHTHLSVLRDVRCLVTTMCQCIIGQTLLLKQDNQQQQK